MRVLTLGSTFVLLAWFAGCAGPGGVHSERTAFDDRVVFRASVREPRYSLSVLNLGPGPVEAFLGAEDAHTHGIEIPEGGLEYVVLNDLEMLEIRHPAGGSAKIEWTILEDLRDRIRVEVDGPPAESSGS